MDIETQEIRQARQRASVKWLLAKAFNNRVPVNLKEPFYRDQENQERLKPQIVVEMANASIYCQTLSNLYSDPNYQNLNHWSILQTLARKGVPVAESADMPLTETILIQTNPVRINAHMAVIESLMILYSKEVSSGDRVPAAVRRLSGSTLLTTGQSSEQLLLGWVSHVCAALKKRITQDIENGVINEIGVRLQAPDIPPLRDFQDLCDGVCLALLISFYCPKIVPWNCVRMNYLPAVEDSIYNVLLVSNFSQKHLPYSVFHMTPEDVTYMRGPMKNNLVALLADLFNLFEIHPAKCVCYPNMEGKDHDAAANEHGITHRRGLTSQPIIPIPDLRSDLDQPQSSGSPSTRPTSTATRSVSSTAIARLRKETPPLEYKTSDLGSTNDDEGFVVHKTRGITTLSSLHNQEPLVPARLREAKEKSSMETKADERGDYVPAGRPSNWEQNRRQSYAGRRSRRNSSSEDSQLTLENFGGSQDQLNTIDVGVERCREREREKERKLSTISVEPAVALRSSIADARGTLQLGYDTDSGSEKQDRETEKTFMRRQKSADDICLHNSRQYKEKELSDTNFESVKPNVSSPKCCEGETTPKRKTSFVALPTKTTTWQLQSALHNNFGDSNEEDPRPSIDATKLTTIRMKLEEKRRRIEQEKRKIEVALSKHQEKIGKAAFLQAINKGKNQHQSEDDTKDEPVKVKKCISPYTRTTDTGEKPQDIPCNTIQDDIESSLDVMKWETLSNESKHTPDIEPADLEKYQQSIAIMNSNLRDIQQDIHRLATQQSQMQAQHLQAQQLMQAQQIANMLHQQPYGSQQQIAGQYQDQAVQPDFGSAPHLSQAFNSASAYHTRQLSDVHQYHQPIQYINESGQYITQHTKSSSPQSKLSYQQQTRNSQPISFYSREAGELCGADGQYDNSNFNSYIGSQINLQYALKQQELNPYQKYIGNPLECDEYPPTHRCRDTNSPQSNQFYLHESSPQSSHRRTWAQSAATHHEQQKPYQPAQLVDINAWQSQGMSPNPIDTGTWKSSTTSTNTEKNTKNGGFILRQNGSANNIDDDKSNQNLFPVHSSPQHRPTPPRPMVRQQKENHHQSSPTLQSDDMAPQSICFIGEEDDGVDQAKTQTEQWPTQDSCRMNDGSKARGSNDNEMCLGKLNITSGSLTYRIPSPSRPSLNSKSFQDPQEDQTVEKGFYISFDDVLPKRPKPPLRAKRSPKKDKSKDSVDRGQFSTNYEKHELLRNNSFESSKGTYNKYNDVPIQHFQLTENQVLNVADRRHLEDVTNQQQQLTHPAQQHQMPQSQSTISSSRLKDPKENKTLVIGTELSNLDPDSVDEMERKKEKIMLLSLQRRQQQEEAKARKEIELMQRREKERQKEEERTRKKEEQMTRRASILEQHRLKKAIEEAEREGKTLDRLDLLHKHITSQHPQTPVVPRLRTQKNNRPRPKTIHVDTGSVDLSETSSLGFSRSKKGSSSNLTGYGQLSSSSMKRDFYRRSQESLTVKESPDEYPSTSSTPIGRRESYKNSRDTDSGLGRATPPRRAPSPGMGPSSRHLPSPSGPGSLPPGLVPKRRVYDDSSSDISLSNQNSLMEYSGPKLYKQPAAKSNRGIILNAVEYCVFPGAVNRDAKQKVLEKIARSEAKHFLILFRDAGCQFRALYSYIPETEQVLKLFGTGPSQVDEVMFDKFFKYNSGGKCFLQVHTKHLTVTIDAFTIHNSLWQGKKVQLPSKKDMALVI